MVHESEELTRLLQLPDLRVWRNDPEHVYESTLYYAATLRELASISRGAFLPVNIEEKWFRNQWTVIQISLVLKGRPTSIFVKRQGDCLDFCFLHRVNRLIEDSAYRFELWYKTDPLIVAVTPEEKHRAESALAWRFETFTNDRIAHFLLDPIEKRLALKDYDGVVADFSQELEIAPAHPELSYYRGIALHELGRRDEAHADWAAAASNGLTTVYDLIHQRYGRSALQF